MAKSDTENAASILHLSTAIVIQVGIQYDVGPLGLGYDPFTALTLSIVCFAAFMTRLQICDNRLTPHRKKKYMGPAHLVIGFVCLFFGIFWAAVLVELVAVYIVS